MTPATIRIQLWEIVHLSWRAVLCNLAYLLAFTVYDWYQFQDLFSGDDSTNARGVPLIALMGYILFVSAISNGLFGITLGFSFRDGFTRPISTMQLVVTPMLFKVFAALILFVIPATLFGFLSGNAVPLAGPSALLACTMTCCIASMWSGRTVAGRWAGLLVTCAAFVLLLSMIDRLAETTLPYWTRMGMLEYWRLPWFAYLGLALLAASAMSFTVFAVGRERCGDPIALTLPVITAASRKFLWADAADRSRNLKPFRNRWRALCWYEFQRTKRILLYPIFLAPIPILLFVGICNSLDPGWEESFYTWAGSVVLCPMIYQIVATIAMGSTVDQNGAIKMPIFDATLPMRCDHMVATKLLVMSGWSLAGCVMMAVAAVLQLRFIGYWENFIELGNDLSASVGGISTCWWMIGAASALLLLISAGAMLMTSPNSMPAVSVAVIVLLHLPVIVVDIFTTWSFRPLWITYGYLFPFVTVAICGLMLRESLGSHFAGKPYLIVTLSMWALLVCTTVSLAVKLLPAIPTSIPLWAYMNSVTMLLVPLAATAFAPLTLAAHRHAY